MWWRYASDVPQNSSIRWQQTYVSVFQQSTSAFRPFCSPRTCWWALEIPPSCEYDLPRHLQQLTWGRLGLSARVLARRGSTTLQQNPRNRSMKENKNGAVRQQKREREREKARQMHQISKCFRIRVLKVQIRLQTQKCFLDDRESMHHAKILQQHVFDTQWCLKTTKNQKNWEGGRVSEREKKTLIEPINVRNMISVCPHPVLAAAMTLKYLPTKF